MEWIRQKPEHESGDYYFSGRSLVTRNVLDEIGEEQVGQILKDLFSCLHENWKNGKGLDYLQVYTNKDNKIFIIDQLSKTQLEGDGYTEEQKKEYNYFTMLFDWEY